MSLMIPIIRSREKPRPLLGFKSQGGFAVDLKRPNRWYKDHGPYDVFAFSPSRRTVAV
jgi:hypothetical protein